MAMIRMIGTIVGLLWTLVPAAVLFSLFFVFDGNMRWLGLMGVIPLLLHGLGCPSCGARRGDGDFHPWVGH